MAGNDGLLRRRSGRRPGALVVMSVLVVAGLLLAKASGTGRGEPSSSSPETPSRIAFGSCNKQFLPQPMWRSIEELSPDVWLWIGDAVYVDHDTDGNVVKMKETLQHQLENKDYRRFISKVPRIEGVWDDHDFGVNDAGKELDDHEGRVDAFLNFLGVGEDDPRRGGKSLYSSHVFGEAPRKVKVIQLDLRTARDKYYIFDMSGKQFPFASKLGALLRGDMLAAMEWLSHALCLGCHYDGSIMGEEQWTWLEEQLTDSDASVHVMVSTLQMMTSNPLVESWGHFPKSRARVLDLLDRTQPAGLVILSGDVHHAELASGWRQQPQDALEGLEADAGSRSRDACSAHASTDSGGRRGVVEVTASGMTHSCSTNHGPTLCEAFLRTWKQHRLDDDAYFIDRNFGDIDIEWADEDGAPQPAKMMVSVRDMNGTVILPVVEYYGDKGRHDAAAAAISEAARQAEPVDRREGETPGSERRSPGRAFLDRPPLPECVEPVLPVGCTARKLSAVAATMAILVMSSCTICFMVRSKRRAGRAQPGNKRNGHGSGGVGRNGNGASNGHSAPASKRKRVAEDLPPTAEAGPAR